MQLLNVSKLPAASYEEVRVKLPKFETETRLVHGELADFCRARGAELPFLEDADFSAMSDSKPVCITDIIQKSKIRTDESGIETAAATALMMELGSAPIDEETIREFYADKPFRYLILMDSDQPEPLFIGRVVR